MLTLAAGIGAGAGILSVVNAVLLRPLPSRNAERIVSVYKYYAGQEDGTPTVSGPDLPRLPAARSDARRSGRRRGRHREPDRRGRTGAGRARKIGISMALGAQRRHILTTVLGHGLRLTVVGTVLGLAATLAATRLLAGLLYAVSAADPLTYAAVTALPAVTSLLACLIPARRASRVDPLAAPRTE